MGTLKQVLIGFSAAAIFIGALTLLYPSGKMEKSVKYAFSLIFLCACVSLFCVALKIDISFDLPTISYNADGIKSAAQAQSEFLCEKLLDDYEIPYKKIDVQTNIDATGSIYINRITVYTDCEKEKVYKSLEGLIDAKQVTVIYE